MANFGSCDIVLSSPVYEITEQFRASKARYAKGLRVGDHIQFRMPFHVNPGASHGGNYVTECEIYRLVQNGPEELVCTSTVRELQGAYRTDDDPDPTIPTSVETMFGVQPSGTKPVFRIVEC